MHQLTRIILPNPHSACVLILKFALHEPISNGMEGAGDSLRYISCRSAVIIIRLINTAPAYVSTGSQYCTSRSCDVVFVQATCSAREITLDTATMATTGDMAGAEPATVAVTAAALVAAAGQDLPPVAPAVAALEQPQDLAVPGGGRTNSICVIKFLRM
jgi:hypothetical protein